MDLTFTGGRASEAVLGWTLGEDFCSDHLSTHLHVASTTVSQPTRTSTGTQPRLAWSKANWNKFNTSLAAEGLDFDNLHSHQEIDRAAANYTTALGKAIAGAVLEVVPGSQGRLRGWWNPELDKITQVVKELQEKARQNPTFANEARRARNNRRKAVRAAMQRYLMLRLQTTRPQDVWKVLRGAKPAHTKAIPDLNGHSGSPNKCVASCTTLSPPPAEGNDIPTLQAPAADLREEYAKVTSTEVSAAISRCNKQSACGYDHIPYTVLEKAHKHLPSLLPNLFTASIRVGFFPEASKHANCVVIPKGVKRDPSIPKSYRPISLLSNVSKVFEKLMARRIAKAALRVKALSSTQFGAIENRSAIDALFAITHPAAEVLAIPTPSGRRNPPDRPTFLANDI